MTNDEMGRRVKVAREYASLTQKELATAIGVDQPMMSRIELGRRSLTSVELGRVIRATGESYDYFLRDEFMTEFGAMRALATTEAERRALREAERFIGDYEWLLTL